MERERTERAVFWGAVTGFFVAVLFFLIGAASADEVSFDVTISATYAGDD